jgi:hypothetical protein
LLFSAGATAWLDAGSEHVALIYAWCFALAESGTNPGQIVSGYEPTVRIVQVPASGEVVEVTYIRHLDRVKILLIETWQERV